MIRVLVAGLALVMTAQTALAAQKAAVFPFELVVPPKEEDFFIGAKGPDAAEAARLVLAQAEFTKLMTADGRYEAVDLTPYAADIDAKSPIRDCKGCEVDFARKAGAAGTSVCTDARLRHPRPDREKRC